MHSWATIGLLLCLAAAAALAEPQRLPNVTPYRQMVKGLRADAARTPVLRLVSLGRTGGHRDVWMVRCADPAVPSARTVRIVVLCRQHGDEPAPTEAALAVMHRLATGRDPALRAALKFVTFYFIPLVNPDGAEAMTRDNGAGADLNRDWGVFSQPETRAVARAVSLIGPQVVVDAHNWDVGDGYDADCIEVTRTLGAKTTPLGEAGRALQQDAVARLARSGYGVQSTAYGPDADARLAHRYFARQGRLAFLVETHSGDPRDVADFQRRQGMYTALIHGLARRYGGNNAAERLALARVEKNAADGAAEGRLFPATIAARTATTRPVHSSLLWLGALCLYAFALWAAGQGGRSPAAVPAATVRSGRRRGEIAQKRGQAGQGRF